MTARLNAIVGAEEGVDMLTRGLITAVTMCAYPLLLNLTQAEETRVVIGLIGDSTVATTYGWGPAFAAEAKDGVRVLNYAKNGATLDSLSKDLDKLVARKPDYILIQFGHNDMKQYDTDAYSKKLKDYVQRVALHGSHAVVLSSVTRRHVDGDGKIAPAVINGRTLRDYAQAARSIAQEMEVPFIDLHSISIDHHNKIGPEESATYDFKPDDKTHFSKTGAKAIAGLIIKELKTTVPELAPYFN